MALSIACWVRDTAIINNQRSLEYSVAFLNAIAKTSNYLNTSINGMRSFEYNQKYE
jgi:hypothetical protein